MTAVDLRAEEIFQSWLSTFSTAFESQDAERVAGLFAEDGFWKDLLAFTWDYPTFEGRGSIKSALSASLSEFKPRSVRLAKSRTGARFVKRAGRDLIEAYFDFDTVFGCCTGFVRLQYTPDAADLPKVWILLTTLQQLYGYEERIGERRPTGDEYARNQTRANWSDGRRASLNYDDRDPEVIIIGGGHAGLALAARFKAMNVDALVIEKASRIGDVWRERYHSLTLHNQVFANHLPYMPFPETWPVWLPKDKLADWLESYASALEINVWLRMEVTDARFDDVAETWDVVIRDADGARRTLRCRHLVAAMGISGSIPNVPELPGQGDYRGVVQHSSQFTSGSNFAGKRAIVVGTGNSGHDVAQDLHLNGAEVALLQRGPSCVVSLEPTATKIYSIYSQGLPVEDVDLQTAAVPFAVLEDTYKRLTKKGQVLDATLVEGLNAAGFQTFQGSDDTGFHMMYLRGEGGYYIDVGCSGLIANGAIKTINYDAIDRFVESGLRLQDGTVWPADLVVLATGFKNMQENISRILGAEVGARIGKVWGFDQHHMMRNMWTQTAQKGFWVMGGGLIDSRLFSRFLALQIAAALAGKLPARNVSAPPGDNAAAGALHG